jgi:hypothetical protein
MSQWGTNVGIPTFVRIKPGALDRLGIYAARHRHREVALMVSQGLPDELPARAEASLRAEGAKEIVRIEAEEASFEAAGASSPTCPGTWKPYWDLVVARPWTWPSTPPSLGASPCTRFPHPCPTTGSAHPSPA